MRITIREQKFINKEIDVEFPYYCVLDIGNDYLSSNVFIKITETDKWEIQINDNYLDPRVSRENSIAITHKRINNMARCSDLFDPNSVEKITEAEFLEAKNKAQLFLNEF